MFTCYTKSAGTGIRTGNYFVPLQLYHMLGNLVPSNDDLIIYCFELTLLVCSLLYTLSIYIFYFFVQKNWTKRNFSIFQRYWDRIISQSESISDFVCRLCLFPLMSQLADNHVMIASLPGNVFSIIQKGTSAWSQQKKNHHRGCGVTSYSTDTHI